MAQVKINTPTGTAFVHTNNAVKNKREWPPVLYTQIYDKEGWFREDALMDGYVELVEAPTGHVQLWTSYKNVGMFIVDNFSREALLDRKKFDSLSAARDHFRHVAKNILY